MGRRGRARERAAAAAAGEQAVPARELLGRKVLRWLNPIKQGTRGRARFACLAFGLLALMLTGAGLANDRMGLVRPAVLLAILAVLWGVRWATMPREPEP